MARPKKKIDVELDTTVSVTATPVRESIRDERGLVKGVEYTYDSFGFVNWRDLISSEHIVLNKGAYAKDGEDISSLTKEQVEEKKKTAPEDRLLIKLSGFRILAKLRGFTEILPAISYGRDDTVVCETTIRWIGNYETDYREVTTKGTASASRASVAPTYVPFLEAIASNRAFVRAVREFLGIFTVCEEELNTNEVIEVSSVLRPSKYLIKICKEKGIEFKTVVSYLEAHGLPVSPEWDCLEQIPDKIATEALALIKE